MQPGDPRGVEDSLGLTGRGLLDRYEVGAAIAHGGMAIIYEGRDRRLYRPVCVKVFHRLRPGEAAYKTAYEHFVQEAFALSQFSHPNTLRIYDFGYLEGDVAAPFFVSELLEGGTLSQLVRRHGPLSPADAHEILEPVAGALAEAHARGIVHRDIKPSNILFGKAGARRIVKLCDFGIAKVVDVAVDLDDDPRDGEHTDGAGRDWRAEDTHLGAGMPLRLYSPGWAAPEQVRGERVGPAADIYALGLIAGYVLAGRTLTSSKPVVDDRARIDLDAALDAALASTKIPAPMADLIRRACAADVDARIGSADAFAEALRAAVRETTRAAAAPGHGHGPGPGIDTEPYRRSAQILSPDEPATPTQPVEAFDVLDARDILPLPPPPMPPLMVVAPLAVAPLPPSPSPSPPEPKRTAPAHLVVDPSGQDEILVGGRRMRLVAMRIDQQLDLGGDGPWLRSPARFRVTITPSKTAAPRVNMRGLNCFVVQTGARPSTAIDVEADMDVDLIAPDRSTLDNVRCSVGRAGDGSRLYDLGPVTIAVPAAAGAVMLDFGPGRELALLHRGAAAAVRRRR